MSGSDGRTGLTAALVEDLVEAVGPAGDGLAQVLLWLDPDRSFEPLWPDVARGLQACGIGALLGGLSPGAQLQMKLAILRQEQVGRRSVAYLPGASSDGLEARSDGATPQLWSVYEYRFKGKLWALEPYEPGTVPETPTLLTWLERRGVGFLDDQSRVELSEGGSGSLLTRYAAANAGRSLDDWPKALRASDVRSDLGGDSGDRLADLILHPRRALESFGAAAELVLDQISEVFGLDVRSGSEPDILADALAMQLALTGAWDAFGRPADFPFASRLPEAVDQRERCITFLEKRVPPGTPIERRFLDRVTRGEPRHDLRRWAEERREHPRWLPRLSMATWDRLMGQLADALQRDWRAAAALVLQYAESDATDVHEPAVLRDEPPFWEVVNDLASLLRLGDAVAHAVGEPLIAGELCVRYVDDWWRLDDLHLEIRAAASSRGGLEQIRRLADLSYFEAVERLNHRFTTGMQGASGWPPVGFKSVTSLRDTLWSSARARRAVVIIDALRFDLGKRLASLVEGDLGSVATTLPTTTPFGMTALLPLGESDLEIELGESTRIREVGGCDLATRKGRKEFLGRVLLDSRGKRYAGFADVDDLLNGAAVPDSRIVVAFDNAIDELGHKGGDEFAALSRARLTKLARVVRLLHEAGIGEVHLVTDHGFMLLPTDRVADIGTPDVVLTQVLKRESRWVALKPEMHVPGLLAFPLPLDPRHHRVGFPLGARTLTRGGDYFHGGVSLQETVIPHIVSRREPNAASLRVRAGVTNVQLTGGTVAVVLEPEIEGQPTLEGIAPRRVRLWIETSAGGSASLVTQAQELAVAPDAPSMAALYLEEGIGLAAGAALILRVADPDTGEELSAIPLTMIVDWD